MSIFSRKLFADPEPLKDSVVYLIDTENVKTVWTLLLEKMTDQDRIYVFYTMNSGSVSYEAINGIMSSGKHVELKECFTGKNGLDFQLVSYLGYLIRENENADYCIISDDGGYDAAIKFWEKRGIKVSRKTAVQVSGKPAKPARGSRLSPLKPRAKKPAAPAPQSAPKAAEADKADRTPARKTPQTKPGSQPAAKQEKKADTKPASKPAVKVEDGSAAKSAEAVKKPETAAKTENAVKTEGSPKAVSSDTPAEKSAPAPQKTRKYRVSAAKLSELLSEEDPDMRGAVYELLEKAGGPQNLADIHDGIEKIYRDEKATEIYRLIKAHVRELYLQ